MKSLSSTDAVLFTDVQAHMLQLHKPTPFSYKMTVLIHIITVNTLILSLIFKAVYQNNTISEYTKPKGYIYIIHIISIILPHLANLHWTESDLPSGTMILVVRWNRLGEASLTNLADSIQECGGLLGLPYHQFVGVALHFCHLDLKVLQCRLFDGPSVA